jgi:hypothetical protein
MCEWADDGKPIQSAWIYPRFGDKPPKWATLLHAGARRASISGVAIGVPLHLSVHEYDGRTPTRRGFEFFGTHVGPLPKLAYRRMSFEVVDASGEMVTGYDAGVAAEWDDVTEMSLASGAYEVVARHQQEDGEDESVRRRVVIVAGSSSEIVFLP